MELGKLKEISKPECQFNDLQRISQIKAASFSTVNMYPCSISVRLPFISKEELALLLKTSPHCAADYS